MLTVDVWADVVCGWAYIGKRRLERALKRWDGPAVAVSWKPYRIDPMAPARAVPLELALTDPIVQHALTQCAPGLDAERNRRRVAAIAQAEGLSPWAPAWRADSTAAHAVIAAAADQEPVVEALMRAHFLEGRDISDPAVIEALGGSQRADAVAADLTLHGRAIGVNASPTFACRGLLLRGAQAPDGILAFLREAAERPERCLPEPTQRLRDAEALLGAGDPFGALRMLRPLLDEHGDDRAVRLLAGRAFIRSAQLGRAERTLRPLVTQWPDDAYAHELLSLVLRRTGRHDEAATHAALARAMGR